MFGQKREQKEQINGLLERQLSKRAPSPAAELELGSLGVDGEPGAGAGGLRAAVAQVRLLERRTSSRPGTPTSNASTDTPTPSEQNDVDEDLLDGEDEAPGSEPEGAPQRLKRPFDLLIAAAMERNPTQFQLPSDLTCTTALPGQAAPPCCRFLSAALALQLSSPHLFHCLLFPLFSLLTLSSPCFLHRPWDKSAASVMQDRMLLLCL